MVFTIRFNNATQILIRLAEVDSQWLSGRTPKKAFFFFLGEQFLPITFYLIGPGTHVFAPPQNFPNSIAKHNPFVINKMVLKEDFSREGYATKGGLRTGHFLIIKFFQQIHENRQNSRLSDPCTSIRAGESLTRPKLYVITHSFQSFC
jgi:hypothetical protein